MLQLRATWSALAAADSLPQARVMFCFCGQRPLVYLSVDIMPEFPVQRMVCFAYVAESLADSGWSVIEDALPPDVIASLEKNCHALWACDELEPAAVGRAGEEKIIPEVRGDYIRWVDNGTANEPLTQYLHFMDQLRSHLNQSLFLGLEDFETHFALYPPGAGYQRHVDRFKSSPLRTVSVVLYLNTAWQPGDGGELCLYLADRTEVIAPRAGTLAVFMSADMPHEVLKAQRHRASLVGWYRRRPDNPLFR